MSKKETGFKSHPSHKNDRRKTMSTHVCDINIPGLPTTLTGQIVPNMTNASLFGICILCKAGCQVLFDDDQSQVIYLALLFVMATKTW
jgi:hypothetical protein